MKNNVHPFFIHWDPVLGIPPVPRIWIIHDLPSLWHHSSKALWQGMNLLLHTLQTLSCSQSILSTIYQRGRASEHWCQAWRSRPWVWVRVCVWCVCKIVCVCVCTYECVSVCMSVCDLVRASGFSLLPDITQTGESVDYWMQLQCTDRQ